MFSCFVCLFMDIFVLWLLKMSPPIICNKESWLMLVMGRQSQLEVQKNLNLFSYKIRFALMLIVLLSVFMVMLMHHCFLSFHTSL